MGENHFAALPVALYGSVLLLSALAYYILCRVLIAYHGRDSTLAIAIGNDFKGKVSLGIYAISIPISFFVPLIACALYILVAIIWLIPDPRIEKNLTRS